MIEQWRPAGPADIRRRKQRAEEIEADGKRLVTARRAAALAGVSHQTVYRWLSEGTLRHYRKGRWIRIDREDLEKCDQSSGIFSTPAHPRKPARA